MHAAFEHACLCSRLLSAELGPLTSGVVASQIVAVELVIFCRYRALGIATAQPGPDAKSKRAQRSIKLLDRLHLNTDLRSNVNRNLPRNVAW